MDNRQQDAWARLELIRWKLKHGKLPRDGAQRMWASYGHGQECAACGVRIDAHEVEFELEFADLAHLRPVRLHRSCCDVWNAERVTFNVITGSTCFRSETAQ